MFNRKQPDQEFETARCPVCPNVIFGRREKAAIYKAHCDDCRATFWWKPWADRPVATLDRDERRKKCGCLSCEAKGR